ncbi:MAG: hypothetical protein ABJV68_05205 [Paracoccaceae bacterium]
MRKLRCPLSGIIAEERWEAPDNKLHNPDGPALLERSLETGITTAIHFFIEGRHHRSAGQPAYLEFDEVSGACIYRAFFVDGQYARPEGMPHIEWIDSETGITYREEYKLKAQKWDHPKLHRQDGPALITYDRWTGRLTGKHNYIRGCKRLSVSSFSLNLD